ncbi:MAG: D-aminoacyl-tRNA deacylase [Myxococcota bacterium]
MKTVVQRVSQAAVRVDDEIVGRIDRGVMLLVGVQRGDTEADAVATARKIASLRIFPGRTPMDLDLSQVEGGCLVVSQFTLAGTVRKGRRPSFDSAMAPDAADALYQRVAQELRDLGLPVQTGRFGAHMHIEMTCDGPVTLLVFTQDGSVL